MERVVCSVKTECKGKQALKELCVVLKQNARGNIYVESCVWCETGMQGETNMERVVCSAKPECKGKQLCRELCVV